MTAPSVSYEPDTCVLVACNTLRDEIEHLSAELGICLRTIWIESQLHNEPEKLASKLQEILDSIQDAQLVLLGFGNCGNVVQGLTVGDFELIVARVDDCISMLFGSQGTRTAYSDANRAIYLTEGWMDDGHNIIAEYETCVEKFGDERAASIFDMMYKHYRTMCFLKTGLYDIGSLKKRTAPICDMLGLEQKTEEATLSYIRALLTGPWPEDRFVHVSPHQAIPSPPFLTAI